MRPGSLVLIALSVWMSGCTKEDPPAPPSSPAASTTAASAASGASAEASAMPAARPSSAPANILLPPGRSRLPTKAEWDAAKKLDDKAIFGVRCDLGGVHDAYLCGGAFFWKQYCEVKQVREYVRVLCRPEVTMDDRPAWIDLTLAPWMKLDVYTLATPDVLVAVAPVAEGLPSRGFSFNWVRGSEAAQFTYWKRGEPMPRGLLSVRPPGSYNQGTPSPADQRLCECQKEAQKVDKCDEGAGYALEDCLATYKDDCAALLACSAADPRSPPRCPEGTAPFGPANRCHWTCDEQGACLPGMRCDASAGVKLCQSHQAHFFTARDKAALFRAIPGLPADGAELPGDLPEPKSKPPSVKEWKEGKPVELRGILDCEALVVREWLRLSCSSVSAAKITTTRESGLEVYTHEASQQLFKGAPVNIASVALQVGRGKGYEAELLVDQTRSRVSVEWPEGRARPLLRITTVETGVPDPAPAPKEGSQEAAPAK